MGETTPCAFRSLDAKPGSYDLVAGSGRCEVWEVARGDVPEPILQVNYISTSVSTCVLFGGVGSVLMGQVRQGQGGRVTGTRCVAHCSDSLNQG